MKLIIYLLLLFTVFYLVYPSPKFPNLPPNSLQSFEPADTETPNRRAYFTNLTRDQIMAYYRQYFTPYALRLNYPPEEARTLIRDQIRSSWLEEIYLPFRDSYLVNGFYPTQPAEQININNVHYLNKITVRYIPSHPISRLTILLLAGVSGYLLFYEYAKNRFV